MNCLRKLSQFIVIITTGMFFIFDNQSGGASQDQKDEGGQDQGRQRALFAGGCFWCMESPFEKIPGVLSVASGYAGGTTVNPSYENHAASGHLEVVEVVYDSNRVPYQQLLDVFWRQIDPTDSGGQFVDRGHSYTTAIFYFTEEQRVVAEQSKKALEASGVFQKAVVTPILPATTFFRAEDYHQEYYKNSPLRYGYYRSASGREDFLKRTWKETKPAQNQNGTAGDGTQSLTPLQYEVTQKNGTEPPFNNAYWNNMKEGVYVDIVSGELLFSSTDKFDSGTGWPSFTKPMVAGNLVEKSDGSLFSVRTEVRSKGGNSHLGHVFDDGPAPTGQRYCINSAALRFVPKEKLAEEGLGHYLGLFAGKEGMNE